jgi:hypothetical protein
MGLKTPQQKWNDRNRPTMAAIAHSIEEKSQRITLRLYDDRPDDLAVLEWLKEEVHEGESLAATVRRKLEKLKEMECKGTNPH